VSELRCYGRCKQTLPTQCFWKNAALDRGFQAECKTCRKARDAERSNTLNIMREQRAAATIEERRNFGKSCHRCKLTKPLSAFRGRGSFDGAGYECKDCYNARRRARYLEDSTFKDKCKESSAARKATLTTADKRKYRQAQRQRRKAAGLTQSGKPRKQDAHVTAWRKQPKPARPMLHDAHIKEWKSDRSRFWMWRYRNDPVFNAAQRLRQFNRKARALDGKLAANVAIDLKRGVFRFGALTGYSVDELWDRLAETMPRDASIADFLCGRLHIDHIRPRASFDLTDAEQVRACWALTNLQLLWALDNQRKAARVPHQELRCA
jgi:hypothetical protein